MSGQPRSSASQSTGRFAGIGQLLEGFVITLISVGMLLGGFLLSQLDVAMSSVRPPPTSIAELLPSPTLFIPTVTFTPSPIPSLTPSSTTEITESPTPTPISPLMPSCQPPSDWVVYAVQRGDTLYRLALRNGVTALVLMEVNCLSTSFIYFGQEIYLPSPLYVSPTPPPYCGPPFGWVAWYVVQPGDNLSSLAYRFGVSIEAIRRANCMSGYVIYRGQKLFLPSPTPTPIRTAVPTRTPTPPYSPIPTETYIPTLVPTPTPTRFPTVTPSPPPTGVFTPTVTSTPTSTIYTPTYTPTPAETPSPTSTLTPTGQPTPTPTSSGPTPTSTPMPTATGLSTSTPTSTPLALTPTPTSVLTPSVSSEYPSEL
ncbi:MAG: LysM peptidoglycan-binding domain-containing protein [Chloroflexota bacterium]|nr:LysM peptidoglycan-binding domain-containing protein [Chloroflexota bacterium]